jgi:hypothetical protein
MLVLQFHERFPVSTLLEYYRSIAAVNLYTTDLFRATPQIARYKPVNQQHGGPQEACAFGIAFNRGGTPTPIRVLYRIA